MFPNRMRRRGHRLAEICMSDLTTELREAIEFAINQDDGTGPDYLATDNE